MKRLLIFVAIYAGALLQLYLPSWPLFAGAKPPVLMALALYCAFQQPRRGMWWPVGWAALLHDSLDPGPFGPAVLAFPLMALLANRIRSEIFVDGLVTQLICGALGGMFTTLVAALIYAISGVRPASFVPTLMRFIGSGLLGMAVFPLVSMGMHALETALPKRRGYGWQ